MNIYLCSHNGNLEGAPVMLATLAKQLLKHNHRCHMLLPSSGLLEERLVQAHIPYTIEEHLLSNASNLFRRGKPDLVVANTILAFRIVEKCHAEGIPVLWIVHESDPLYLKQDITQAHFHMANAVVFPSNYARKQYEKFDAGHFHVIPNGIDIRELHTYQLRNKKSDLRDQYNIPGDAMVFLSIGTHHPLKGFDIFIKSGIHVIKQHPEKNIHCIVAGGIHSAVQQADVDALLQKAWNHGIRNRIHIFADFPMIYDLYGLSDCYICASTLETFPMTILEAMAFGLPIIASDVGGIPEQITDNTDGFLVKPQNTNDLVNAMNKVLSEEEHARRIGDAAYKKCTSTFTDGNMHKSYATILKQICCKTSVSLIMRASRPDTIKDAVQAAIATFPLYKEYIIAASPSLPKETLQYLEHIPRVRIVTGTEKREEAGDLHYRLLDMCTGNWIANVDDDDLWIHAPNLLTISDDIGLIHGHYLYLNYYLPTHDRKRFLIEKGHPVTTPDKANGVAGSMWMVRKNAWQTVSNMLQDRSFSHSDWRIFYYLAKAGWNLHWELCVMGIQRRFSYDFPTRWQDTVLALNANSSP